MLITKIKGLANRVRYRLIRESKLIRKKAIDAGVASRIIPGHTGYQKFIIMGMPRSGSNFLASSLRSGKNIIAFGELFNEKSHQRRDIQWDTPGYRTTEKALRLRDADPVGFLESMVFNRRPVGIEALGFKLFYHHADENWAPVWPYLKEQDLKVLHLKRKNYLKVHLSMSVARRTREFLSQSSKPRQLAIHLDYDECLQWFEMTRAWDTEFNTCFKDNLVIHYDDLVIDHARCMREIQEYLNVRISETSSPLTKQARLPLENAILNFDQLKRQFAGSEWAEFFEPEDIS